MTTLKVRALQLIHEKKIELKATQDCISLPVLERIYKKMMIRILFKGIQVENSTIIDGHHRYIASLLADYEIEKFETIRSVAKRNIEWNLVKITEEDWDTTSKIEKLNIEDAIYNGITLEELQMKLK